MMTLEQFIDKENPGGSIAVKLSLALGIGHWLVPGRFPLVEAEKLRSAGIEVTCCQDSSFFPERERKTAAEVKAIRQSQSATEEIMRPHESGIQLIDRQERH